MAMFEKALKVDDVTGNVLLEDAKHDTSDRRRMTKLLELLASHGALINSSESKEGLSPAQLAAKSNNVKLLTMLYEMKSIVNIPMNLNQLSRNENMTALMFAAKFGHIEACAAIIRMGHNINFQNELGMTALHYSGGNKFQCLGLMMMRM